VPSHQPPLRTKPSFPQSDPLPGHFSMGQKCLPCPLHSRQLFQILLPYCCSTHRMAFLPCRQHFHLFRISHSAPSHRPSHGHKLRSLCRQPLPLHIRTCLHRIPFSRLDRDQQTENFGTTTNMSLCGRPPTHNHQRPPSKIPLPLRHQAPDPNGADQRSAHHL
jgi:hypothetical protein